MNQKGLRGQRGFSLVELMVVVGISSILSYAIFLMMRTSHDEHQTSDIEMSIQDSAREGVYKMIQEIRQSAPSKITIGGGGTSLTFSIPNASSPVNLTDYTVNWDGQTVSYARTGTQLIRTYNGSTKVMANDVTAVSFTGNAAQPNIVTIALSIQRQLVNGRNIPATALQLTGQAEVRNT